MICENNRKPVIWLAGDSTMQSYSEEKRPQWGWGEKLLEWLEAGKDRNVPKFEVTHREDCLFDQEKRYEGSQFIIDNCAMAGRSSKSFRVEGRLQDIEKHIQQGDYLLIQFGHNDAGKSKPERYVSLEDFKDSLENFVNVALRAGAKPILLSSIVLCPGEQTETGEAGEISRLLPEYGKVMKEYAAELNIPYVDMNSLTREYLQVLTKEQAETHYLPDHVHLVEKGALAYAKLAASELSKCIRNFCDARQFPS